MSIATTSAGSTAILGAEVTPITNANYSDKEFNSFRISMIIAVKDIASTYNDGTEGYTGLIVGDEYYKNNVNKKDNEVFKPHVPPKMATLASNSTQADIEIARFAYDNANEQYCILVK